MKVEKYLPKHAQDKITAAIGDAEKKVNAELVPVVMTASDDYNETPLKAAILGGGLTGVGILLYDHLMGWYEVFFLKNDWLFVATIALGATLGYALVRFISPLKRIFTGSQRKKERSQAMAERVFSEYRVYETSQRNGVLIFVSLFEHQIDIIPDKGLKEKIGEDEWQKVIQDMKPALKRGAFDEAFIHSINKITLILTEYGMTRSGDAPDELPNHLRENI